METGRSGQELRRDILAFLLQRERRTSTLPELAEIAAATQSETHDVSDQIDILEALGAVLGNRTLGGAAAPMLTGAGKLLLEQLEAGPMPNQRPSQPPSQPPSPTPTWDIFISHASEDKDSFVRPLAERLSRDISVWYDEHTLRLGDSLRESIDRGLSTSRYGLVILSPAFFAKRWPQLELNGLFARETHGDKVILPIWLNLTAQEVAGHSPMLADKVAITADGGIDHVAKAVLKELEDTDSSGSRPLLQRVQPRQLSVRFGLETTPLRHSAGIPIRVSCDLINRTPTSTGEVMVRVGIPDRLVKAIPKAHFQRRFDTILAETITGFERDLNIYQYRLSAARRVPPLLGSSATNLGHYELVLGEYEVEPHYEPLLWWITGDQMTPNWGLVWLQVAHGRLTVVERPGAAVTVNGHGLAELWETLL